MSLARYLLRHAAVFFVLVLRGLRFRYIPCHYLPPWCVGCADDAAS
jgi:hypothetical protein